MKLNSKGNLKGVYELPEKYNDFELAIDSFCQDYKHGCTSM
jgi:hypothetical protein